VVMSLGARARRAIGDDTPQYLVASSGVTVLKATAPVPPDQSRGYVGPYAAVGYDRYIFAGRFLIGAQARYGLIVSGPKSFSFTLSFGFGTRPEVSD